MSASTRSRAVDWAAILFAALFATQSLAQLVRVAASSAAALPQMVRNAAPALVAQGEGEFRWFGLSIYHARLWAPPAGWRRNDAFALEIRYARAIKGHRLAETSADEMRHTGAGSEQERQGWAEAMRSTLPDVREGDTLIGLSQPGAATRFFLNGQPIGEVADPGFGTAFFGIWLSPATSRPELRRMLLGAGR